MNLPSIDAFVVAYPNGNVLDGKLAFLPLPEGLHWSTKIDTPRRDVLDLNRLAPQRVIAEIAFGPSGSRPHEPTHYSTSIRNVSTSRFRVLKFGGYNLSGDQYVLNTITGDYFTAEDFLNWYGVDRDGWIKPGQTVSDPNNYGSGKGYWAYFCLNEQGDEFIIGEPIPKSADVAG